MNQTNKTLKASDTAIIDLQELACQNGETKTSNYRQGYENIFSSLPIIGSVTTNWDLSIIDATMWNITHHLAWEDWVRNNTPAYSPLLRTVIGMEKPTWSLENANLQAGAELVVINWQDGACTPTHGHPRGYMHERLIFGKVKQRTYRIVDAENRIVRPIGLCVYDKTNDIIDAGFNDDAGVKDGAFVHDFTFLKPSATLNLVPEHPKNGKGNKFSVEEFSFKHIGFLLEKLVPISKEATLHLPPGEVILVRSEATADLGDHFYIITDAPKEKSAGIRPVGHAIQAGPDFTELLNVESEMGEPTTVLRLLPEMRDLFLQWHGIQVQKTLIFPKP